MIKYIYAIVMCFFLLGCASTPEVITKVETQYVSIPVPIPCVKAVDLPKPLPDTYPFLKNDLPQEKVRSLLIDRNNRIVYEAQLRAIMDNCVDNKP